VLSAVATAATLVDAATVTGTGYAPETNGRAAAGS
jgi:hypothetical protein